MGPKTPWISSNAAAWAVVALATTGCGGEAGPGRGAPDAADAFCEAALEKVDAFLAQPGDAASAGGTVVVGGTGELQGGMNPIATSLVASTQHQLHVVLMSLVRLDANLEPEPYLAESWRLSPDGSELEFTLRSDVYWHDGTPTTAEDVAFTFERARDPEAQYANAAYFRFYQSVEVVDARTVRFRIRPHSQTLETWAVVPILPSHLLGSIPPAELATHPYGTRCPVGNGPFRFIEHRESDRWVFDANPRFPAGLGGRPRVDRYVFRTIPEQTTLLTELLAGSVHVYLDVRPDQAPAIEESPRARLLAAGGREFAFIAWNSRRPQLADPAVRRALTQAIDRQAIVDALLGGHGRVAETSVPPFHWAHDPNVGGPVSYDASAAGRALGAAGWEDRDGDGVRENAAGAPLDIELLYNTENQLRETIAQIVQADLARVGVRAHPQGLELGTVIGRVTDAEARDFDALILAYETDFRIDDAVLFHSSAKDEGLGLAGTESAKIDALIDSVPLISDRERARGVWSEYQRALVEEQPFTYLYFPDVLTGVSRSLRNVEVDERGPLRTVQRWSLESATSSTAGGR